MLFINAPKTNRFRFEVVQGPDISHRPTPTAVFSPRTFSRQTLQQTVLGALLIGL